MEKGLDSMDGDRESLNVLINCSAMPGKGMRSWHEWWMEMSLVVITSNQNRNEKVSSGSIQDHHHKKNSKTIHTSAGKVMLTFVFEQDGPLLIDFLQRGTTVNVQLYSQTLTTLRQAIKSKRPGKLTRVVLLLHDNARPHTANTITALLQKYKWEVVNLPPYSPDLSPCDYAIFGPLKKAVRGKRFTSDNDVK